MQATLGFVLDEGTVVPVWIVRQETQFGFPVYAVFDCQHNGKEFIQFGIDEAEDPVQPDGSLVPAREYWQSLCERRFENPEAVMEQIEEQLNAQLRGG